MLETLLAPGESEFYSDFLMPLYFADPLDPKNAQLDQRIPRKAPDSPS
jgi:hypothetical protein